LKNGQNNFHYLALCFCGVIAYVTANLCHELIGHGLTSLIQGNQIKLLSSVYFRSLPHSFITDVFGPVANLISGIFILLILKRSNSANFYTMLTLALAAGLNLFFFSWLCLYSGITNTGDLSFAISQSGNPSLWRFILAVVGVFIYYFSFLVLLQSSRQIFSASGYRYSQQFLNRAFLVPYFSAGFAALIAASFFRPMEFNNFYEAFVFPMFLPVIFIPGYLKVHFQEDILVSFPKSAQIKIIVIGLLVFTVFCLTMGRGIRL
jgi:hypothetical protein